jgi:hypothetical protein
MANEPAEHVLQRDGCTERDYHVGEHTVADDLHCPRARRRSQK